MSTMERLVIAVGGWLFLAAAVNAKEHHWLAVGVCLAWGTACFLGVFGYAADRRTRRAQRQNSALLAQIERDQRMIDQQQYRSGEWIRTQEGHYVRLGDDTGGSGGGVGGHDSQRDELGDEDSVR
ncbi:membrane protein [Gordonia phage Float294]|uniref:Uncharacterized protein n=1 Tax=Gordonia phage Skysand TaxID=2301559 RepID=A0A385DTR2_9CAUD|nr:hypothetical protein KNU08_gp18 [Gordonia phage Skysand]AXQ62052.1 hypothetical protein SEA_SKYSAND_18 [Gordonia phage Skysand]QXN74401.1 membrane protein [Gordonia phage Float294]